jgi:AcrR family transcriptional regulator
VADLRSRISAPKIRPDRFNGGSRFDQKLSALLAQATDVFFDKGYEGASMRDLSRATGMSLAGLYYYFQSKERLLYLIQKHTFETILAQLQQRLAVVSDAEQRVRALIANHLEYFLANQKAMTVLAHEDEVLKGQFGDEIHDIKRKYYRTCRELVEELKLERRLGINTRIAVLSLFGMMNYVVQTAGGLGCRNARARDGRHLPARSAGRGCGESRSRGVEGCTGAQNGFFDQLAGTDMN